MPEDTRNVVYRGSGAALAIQPLAPLPVEDSIAGYDPAPLAPAAVPFAAAGPETAVPFAAAGPETDVSGPSAGAAGPVESELMSFKRTVARFVETDRQIVELAARLKAVRAENGEIRDEICKFMEEREFEDVQTKAMRLRLKTASVKPPLKKAELHERVAAYLGGEDAAAAFFEKVYDDRETVQRTSLRRMRVRA